VRPPEIPGLGRPENRAASRIVGPQAIARPMPSDVAMEGLPFAQHPASEGMHQWRYKTEPAAPDQKRKGGGPLGSRSSRPAISVSLALGRAEHVSNRMGSSNRRSASAVPAVDHSDTTGTLEFEAAQRRTRRGQLRISLGLRQRLPTEVRTAIDHCFLISARFREGWTARASTCPRSIGRSFPIFCGGSPRPLHGAV
jgi:hypothetical protein